MKGLHLEMGRVNGSAGAIARAVVVRLVLFIAFVFFVFPVAYAVLTAFQPADVALNPTPTYVFVPTLDAFANLFETYAFGPIVINSLGSSLGASALAVLIGVPAGYAMSRRSFTGRRKLAFWLLCARSLPAVGLGIPAYALFNQIDLTDTLLALILVYLPYNVALTTIMMRVYFDGIPKEIDEAAAVDGAGRWRILISVVLPVARPGVASVAIMCFLFSWNNFFFPLVLTGSRAATIPLALQQFLGSYTLQWNEVMAGVTLLSLPLILLALVFGRYMIGGLAAGSVK
jgi:ABC-type glycerol-3-phosphate transport system permease component